MGQLTSRERLRRAINREEPDRIPLALGEFGCTTLTVGAYQKLLRHLGIDGKTRWRSEVFQSVFIDERILDRFHIDTRGVAGKGPRRRPAQRVDARTIVNEWGVTLRMPEGGVYYDIVHHPLQEADIGDLERHPWPDPTDEGLTEAVEREARELHEQTEYAVVGEPGLGVSVFEQCWYLRGFEAFLVDLVCNKDFAHALLRRVTDIQKAKYGRFLARAGKYLDVVRVGDDLGTQQGPLISPATYREMVGPYHKEYFSYIKARTDAKLLLHSCGSIRSLIPELIGAGVDILNPVQASAVGMDSSRLKLEFGDRLAFWGAIDTQQVLPFGSPEAVEQEVRQQIAELGAGGGFVPGPTNNIQHDVPSRNVVAMLEAIEQYGRGSRAG